MDPFAKAVDDMLRQTPEPRRPRNPRNPLANLLVSLAAILALFGCGGGEPDPADTAKQACVEAVPERLKSPATAEISNVQTSQFVSGVWSVTGTVDSENSFGAMIRSTFKCHVRVEGGTPTLTQAVDFSGRQ